jgi:hypothetical protein
MSPNINFPGSGFFPTIFGRVGMLLRNDGVLYVLIRWRSFYFNESVGARALGLASCRTGQRRSRPLFPTKPPSEG